MGNNKCKIETYEDARAVFENDRWTETKSALLYYWYFGEEFLVETLNNSLESDENNKVEFTKLIKKLKKIAGR